MTAETKAALKKRLLELLVAAITALIAALSTSCAIRWSSNSVELEPRGTWLFTSTNAPAGK